MRLSDYLAATHSVELFTENMQRCPQFVFDNVADYYFQHPKEFWTLNDFPDAKPPFNGLWAEFRWPKTIYSKECGVTNVLLPPGHVKYFGATIVVEPDGTVDMSGRFFTIANGKELIPGAKRGMRYRAAEDGKADYWLPESEVRGMTTTEKAQYCYAFHPIMLGFSFANCRNIETVTVSAPHKLQKARQRRGKLPFHTFSVVNIVPMSAVKKNNGQATTRRVESETGEGVALHIRRGHFAHYGEKYGRKKLFGKYDGRFWIPATAIGDATLGIHDHTYEVKSK